MVPGSGGGVGGEEVAGLALPPRGGATGAVQTGRRGEVQHLAAGGSAVVRLLPPLRP